MKADSEDAEAMVAGVIQIAWDELVVDDVVEALAAMEVFKAGTCLAELLEESAEGNVSSFLVGLLMQGLPDLWKLVVIIPGKSAWAK